MKNIFLSLFAIFWVFKINAQIKIETFESISLQERRVLQYYIPENYSSDRSYPLVVVMDAERLFEQVVSVSRYYSKYQGMPESIIVGVNQEAGQLRWEDCAFNPETGLPTEKGAQFFDFISLELIPSITEKYNLAPFKMFVGFDITANFGNYFIVNQNSPFRAYVHIAPLLPEVDLKLGEQLNKSNGTVFYHLISGNDRGENRTKIRSLDARISGVKSNNVHYFYDAYPDIDAISATAYALGKAWDRTFQMFKSISPDEYKERILTSSQPVYNYLENKLFTIEELFGYKIKPSLNDVIAIYAGTRKKQDYESLKPLSDLCKAEYPDTMLGYYLEGEYYEFTGEPKKALKSFERAFGLKEIDFLTREMALNKMDALKTDFGF